MNVNRMRRRGLMGLLATTARVGLHGGLLKDEEGHGGGGGDSGGGGNNGGGNSGDSGQSGGNQNNDGQSFNAESFWNSPEPEGTSQESQGPTDAEFGQSLMQTITNFQGTPVFDAETASQIADGNLEGVNQRLQAMQQGVLRQSMIMMAQILQRFDTQVDGRISGQINQNSTRQSDESMLSEQFPSFTKPEVRPVIQGVFQQSLKHSKGDRKAALEMTRGMLKSMGQLGGSDFGFSTPPGNPDDHTSNGPSSLVQELLSMR